MVAVGERAPAFELEAHDGTLVKVGSGSRESVLVLYFYPADHTAGCTAEACSFRDAYEDFAAAGAEVVGISGDSLERHRGFADKYELPFKLLTDTDGKVSSAYGARTLMAMLPGRVTFVIDKHETVRMVFNSMFRFNKHVGEALEAVRELSAEPRPSPEAKSARL